jgi:hypothetical protein
MHIVQKRTVAWPSANGGWRLAGPRSFALGLPSNTGEQGAKTALDENDYLHSTTKHKLAKVSFFDSTQGFALLLGPKLRLGPHLIRTRVGQAVPAVDERRHLQRRSSTERQAQPALRIRQTTAVAQ